jgi:hypothetical protein
MYRIIRVCVVLSSLVLIFPLAGQADVIITRDWAFIDNRPTDDIFGFTGLRLNLTVRAVDDVGGSDALEGGSASVVASNTAFPFPTPLDVPLNAVFPIIGGAEYTTLPPIGANPFSSVEGTYTYTVISTTPGSATSTTHTLDKFEIIPIPTNLAFSNNSTTPIFTFEDPDPTPNVAGVNRKYVVDIFDASKTNIFESDVLLMPSFAVPLGVLEPGELYYFRALSLDFDPADFLGQDSPHSNVENRAIAYATFNTAVPEPGILILLGISIMSVVGLRRLWKE